MKVEIDRYTLWIFGDPHFGVGFVGLDGSTVNLPRDVAERFARVILSQDKTGAA